jgi:hypothetical protein
MKASVEVSYKDAPAGSDLARINEEFEQAPLLDPTRGIHTNDRYALQGATNNSGTVAHRGIQSNLCNRVTARNRNRVHIGCGRSTEHMQVPKIRETCHQEGTPWRLSELGEDRHVRLPGFKVGQNLRDPSATTMLEIESENLQGAPEHNRQTRQQLSFDYACCQSSGRVTNG